MKFELNGQKKRKGKSAIDWWFWSIARRIRSERVSALPISDVAVAAVFVADETPKIVIQSSNCKNILEMYLFAMVYAVYALEMIDWTAKHNQIHAFPTQPNPYTLLCLPLHKNTDSTKYR